MSIFDDHKKLYPIAGLLFLALTIIVVIAPALNNQKNNAPLPGSKWTRCGEAAQVWQRIMPISDELVFYRIQPH
jgi:hypothetical protein